MAYFFIALTILLTVYGQLILKWQVAQHAHLVSTPFALSNIAALLLKPWVISGFAAAFAASLCWMAAISRMPLSKAYPYMAVNFVLVAIMAAWLFQEQLDGYKIAGTLIVIIGVLVISRSA